MKRFIEKSFLYSIVVLVAISLVPHPVQAKQPPGADLVGIAYSRETGLAVLSRFELFLSTDGVQWKPAGLMGKSEALSAVAVAKNVVLVAAESGKIFRSVGGGPFQTIDPPKDPYGRIVAPIRIMAARSRGNEFMASSGQGVIRSVDGGVTWEAIADPFWKDPEARQIIRVGYVANKPVIVTRKSTWRDAGEKFERIRKGLPEVVNPTVAAQFGGQVLMALPGQGIYLATDDSGWRKLDGAPGDPLAFVGFVNGGFLAARPTTALHVTDRKGEKWTQVGGFSPSFIPVASASTPFGNYVILRGKGLVKLDGADFRTVELPMPLSTVFAQLDTPGSTLAGTQGGVYFTSNNARSWEDVTPLQLGSPVNNFLVLEDGRILLGSEGSGVFVTSDGGMSWENWSRGLGTANTIKGLVKFGNGVLAGTENGLMLTAMDLEPSWKRHPGGLGRVSVGRLIQDGKLYWLSSLAGVFKAEGTGDFKPVPGYKGRVTGFDASGGRVLAIINGKILLGDSNGTAKELSRLPNKAIVTDVVFFAKVAHVSSSGGIFKWKDGSWLRVDQETRPMSGIITTPDGVKGLIRGAGNYTVP